MLNVTLLAMGLLSQITQPLDTQDDAARLPFVWLLVLGLLLVTVGLMMRLRKKGRQKHVAASPGQQIQNMRQMRGMRGDLEDLMVEIEQLAKRFATQLDAKQIEIEQVLDEAEQKLVILKKHVAQLPYADQLPAPQPDDPLARHIYKLADGGLDAGDIAQKLDEHVGKVELILALRAG